MVIMIHSYNTSCISEYPNPQQQWSSPKPYSSMLVAFVSFSFPPSLFRAISILQPKRKPQWRRKPKYWAKSTKPKDPSRIYLLFNLIFFIYYHYFALIQDLIFAFLICESDLMQQTMSEWHEIGYIVILMKSGSYLQESVFPFIMKWDQPIIWLMPWQSRGLKEFALGWVLCNRGWVGFNALGPLSFSSFASL